MGSHKTSLHTGDNGHLRQCGIALVEAPVTTPTETRRRFIGGAWVPVEDLFPPLEKARILRSDREVEGGGGGGGGGGDGEDTGDSDSEPASSLSQTVSTLYRPKKKTLTS